MKKTTLLFFITGLFAISSLHSQTVFWTEDFGAACSQGNLASGTTTANGTWNVTATGTNDPEANVWYISAKEAGVGANNCGADGCTTGNTDRTLHISSNPSWAGDLGAAYEIGGFCGLVICVSANARAESPVINCTGQNTITLNFDYIEFGDGTNDNATLWYFDGATWTQLIDLPKTACCGGPCNSGSLQGQWTAFSIALPASANNNPNVRIGFNWTNNDDGVGWDPSFAVDDITLTVPGGAAPVPSFTLSSPICAGTTVNLNGTATNSPTSWLWSVNPAAGVTIANPNTQNTTATFTAAGTYTVQLDVSNGSGSNNTQQVILVNPEPTITVTPNPVTLCSGSSQNLTASGATSYTWSPSSGLTCTNCAVTTASPTVSTTYTVIGTTGSCDDTVTVPVTVTAAIVAGATATSTVICAGGSATLTGTGGSTYTWSPDPSLSCTNCQSPVATPTVTTTYTVTVASGSCPTATASITISVTSAVTASVTPTNTTICSGSNVTLTASGGSNYSWSPGTGLSCTTCPNPTASPTVTTTYSVAVSSGTCPADTATVTVNVTPATVATASSASSIICNGQSTTLNATGGSSGTSYTWAPAGSLSCTNCQSPTATPTVTTTYTVTVTNGSCPSATATVVVTVNACVPPVAAFTAADDTVCTGECIDFTSTSTGATSMNWQFLGGSASPSTSSTSPVNVCFFTPGTYTVQLIVSNANGSDTVTQTIFIAPVPVANTYPAIDTIVYGTNTNIVASGGTIYSWTPSTGLSCVACSTTTASPLGNTWYYCTVTNQYGCSATDSTFIIVDIQCGEIFIPTAFSPNNDYNNDVLKVRGNCLTKINFIVYDRWGEKVFESDDPSVGWDGTYKNKEMDTGVFYYHLTAKTIDGKSYEMKGNVTLIR